MSLCGFVVFVLFASFWRVVSGAVLVRLVVFQLLKVVAATVEEPALVVRFYLWLQEFRQLNLHFLRFDCSRVLRGAILPLFRHVSRCSRTIALTARLSPASDNGIANMKRNGEIRRLTWDKVDLKIGFIRLAVEDTKEDLREVVMTTLHARHNESVGKLLANGLTRPEAKLAK